MVSLKFCLCISINVTIRDSCTPHNYETDNNFLNATDTQVTQIQHLLPWICYQQILAQQ